MLDGKYWIVGRLGTGGMGTVYDGWNLAIGRRVAIKLLHPDQALTHDAIERFEQEAQAAARIGHPNVVDVLDMGRDRDGARYMVMERLEGECLFDRLVEAGPLPTADAVAIVVQVLSGLEAAHEVGIIHRDLKPENVFLATTARSRDVVKILDFGVAKFPAKRIDGRCPSDGEVVGTPVYMSPEQASGGPVDGRTDLYAAGVLLYELLSTRLPFEGDGPKLLTAIATRDPVPIDRVAPWLPPEIASVVARAMAPDPAARFQTAGEFIEALSPFLDQEASQERSVGLGAAPIGRRSTREVPTLVATTAILPAKGRRRRLAWVMATALALAAGTAALVGAQARTDPPAVAPAVPRVPIVAPSRPGASQSCVVPAKPGVAEAGGPR
ncbi:MAG: serine/threonine protein kinase [Deltaproteobacteria bacterium]|nr:serine/threonine protein kinase [Deltaproteobacteria bacterium]